MHPKKYLVAQRDNYWVIVEGPEQMSAAFSSRQVAIDAALLQANADAAELRAATVFLEKDGQVVQLYSSADTAAQMH